MLVDFSGSTDGIVVFGFALGDVEAFAGDDYIGGVGCAGPLLAVGAMAEGCYFWFALGRWGSEGGCGRGGEMVYGVFVVDFATHATAFCHYECGLADVMGW
jgi:hypothetical protein